MQKRSVLLAGTILLSMVSFATAENTVRETALFIKSALSPASPVGYWVGDAEHPPTFYFHMLHQQWYAGTDTVRSEGTKLLGCVAPVVRTIFGLGADHTTPGNDAPYQYRITVFPPPPGGAVTVVAEDTVKKEDCAQNIEAQRLFLDIIFPEEKHQSSSQTQRET